MLGKIFKNMINLRAGDHLWLGLKPKKNYNILATFFIQLYSTNLCTEIDTQLQIKVSIYIGITN